MGTRDVQFRCILSILFVYWHCVADRSWPLRRSQYRLSCVLQSLLQNVCLSAKTLRTKTSCRVFGTIVYSVFNKNNELVMKAIASGNLYNNNMQWRLYCHRRLGHIGFGGMCKMQEIYDGLKFKGHKQSLEVYGTTKLQISETIIHKITYCQLGQQVDNPIHNTIRRLKRKRFPMMKPGFVSYLACDWLLNVQYTVNKAIWTHNAMDWKKATQAKFLHLTWTIPGIWIINRLIENQLRQSGFKVAGSAWILSIKNHLSLFYLLVLFYKIFNLPDFIH